MMILITLALGLFFLVGAGVVKFYKNSEFIEHASIAVAFGAMIGIGVFDIAPEVLEMTPYSLYYLPIIGVIAGFLMLSVLDKFIPEHEEEDNTEYNDENMEHIGIISTFAIVIHNMIEGMAVYSLALSSPRQGIALMAGIGLHNIPMGMFLYSTLKSRSALKRRGFMTVAVLSTFLGGLLMMFIRPYITSGFNCVLYGIALGMILFIVLMELLPYIRKNKNRAMSCVCAVIGLVLVLVSTVLE